MDEVRHCRYIHLVEGVGTAMESNSGVTSWSGSLSTGDVCPSQPPPSAAFRPVVGVPNSKRKNVVNIWMIVTMVVGTAIVLADGLSRGPVTERDVYWNGPLEYHPYAGTVGFAAVSLLLMLLYVRKAQLALAEGLFLWFVFCTTAYTRDFAYIRWPGTPLFVTEAVLGILFLWYLLFSRSKGIRLPVVVIVLLMFLMAAGALAAARGLLGRCDPIFVLRDLAMVAYGAFLPITHRLFCNWLSIKRLVIWFVLGAALSVLNGMAWFLAVPQERRFIYYGIYVLIALVGTLIALATRLLPARWGWALVALFCLGLAVANARSLFVALAGLVVSGLLGGALFLRKAMRVRTTLTALVVVTLMASTIAFLFLRTEAGRDFAGRSGRELASGVLNSGEDANWQFRLSAWKEASKRFMSYPLAGEGFGVPFTFELLPFDNDPRPHNTFLTVLYKMGLIGFLPLLALLTHFLWTVVRGLLRNSRNHGVAFAWIVVLAEIAFCFYGAANLLLESPFLASLFWAFMGLGLSITRLLDHEWLSLEESHASSK
jgi:O-antigen ligase